MRLRVLITTHAQNDPLSILDYLAEDSPSLAVRVVERLPKATVALGEAALRYPTLVNHEDSGVRRRVAGSHSIYYRARPEAIEVLHILHSARDYERLLFPEN